MTTTPRRAAVPLMQRLRATRLPSPEERLAIRKKAGVSREDIARELRAQGIAVTEGAVKWWEKPKAEGGFDPRPDRAAPYRRLLEQLKAETAQDEVREASARCANEAACPPAKTHTQT